MNIDSILTNRTVSESPQHFDQNVIGAHVSIVIYLRRQGTSVQSFISLFSTFCMPCKRNILKRFFSFFYNKKIKKKK